MRPMTRARRRRPTRRGWARSRPRRAARLRYRQDLRTPAPRRGAESAGISATGALAPMAGPVNRSAGQGTLSVTPMRRTALVAGAAALWLLLQLVLVVWWATVIERQARRLATLESFGGAAQELTAAQWTRTRLMLIGESSTFLALLLIVTLL